MSLRVQTQLDPTELKHYRKGDTRIEKGLESNESLFDGYTGTGHRESGPRIDEEDGQAVWGFGLLCLPAQAAVYSGSHTDHIQNPTCLKKPLASLGERVYKA